MPIFKTSLTRKYIQEGAVREVGKLLRTPSLTTDKITLTLAVLMLTASAAFGDDGKKGFIVKIFDGFAESTRAVNKINRENMAAVKADSGKESS